MQTDKVLSLLGLSEKARKAKSGGFQVEEAIKSQKAWVVIIAGDASDNTKKDFRDMSSFYEVDCYIYATKETLGRSIGKEERSVVAVCDEGLAKSIVTQLEAAGTVKENQ